MDPIIDWESLITEVTTYLGCYAQSMDPIIDRESLITEVTTYLGCDALFVDSYRDRESLITEVTTSLGYDAPSVDSYINIYGGDMVVSVLVMLMTGRVNYLSVPRTILHRMNPLNWSEQ